ncbi:glycoside hydrolase family 47 protein [Boletus edulis BED1]|uniref:alpha-1,2-Mannosidase n=1 Tax=Boletus edulis BED1 TaxID=1328754 RepID=A0AAD4C8D7_BOLED|nr:glycoside hydrolase family 47 protein [Boletus edulis BED1]
MSLLRYLVPNIHQYRRIAPRYLLLILAISAVFSTLYYAWLRSDEVLFLTDADFFWPPETPEIWAERAAQVKEAFRHAYRGYEQHAFPHDELLPVSNGSTDNFNGWGVTSVDSLDTMLLMGLEDEYARALPVISQTNFSLPSNNHVPFFETVIRYLGGLLAAYAISGDDLLRDKADELATKLASAFNTTSGFPVYAVDTYNGKNLASRSGVLAEIASFQIEYAYLGKITGKKEHVDRATLVTNLLYNATLDRFGGMYPTAWNLDTGAPSDSHLTVGALADSGHEYTLKQFLMTARTDKRNLEMYIRFTSYVINNLLFLTPERHLLYVTDAQMWKRGITSSHYFQHLACFFPGLLALGVHLLPLNHLDAFGINVTALADDFSPADRYAYAKLAEFDLADVHLWAAEGLAQTCYLTYADQPTGLGPEIVQMDVNETGAIQWIDALRTWKADRDGRSPPGVGDMKPWTSPLHENVTVEQLIPAGRRKGDPDTFGRDYLIRNTGYYLRPETVESFYILWRTTGDVKWRHRGWDVFQAIERYTKTDSGYTSVMGVHTAHPTPMNAMPSYFLAETLKYLYLLFLDEDPLPLNSWVFNTEAHALPVFAWSAQEREAYGIV